MIGPFEGQSSRDVRLVRIKAWAFRAFASRYLATGGGPVVTVWECSGKGPAGRHHAAHARGAPGPRERAHLPTHRAAARVGEPGRSRGVLESGRTEDARTPGEPRLRRHPTRLVAGRPYGSGGLRGRDRSGALRAMRKPKSHPPDRDEEKGRQRAPAIRTRALGQKEQMIVQWIQHGDGCAACSGVVKPPVRLSCWKGGSG